MIDDEWKWSISSSFVVLNVLMKTSKGLCLPTTISYGFFNGPVRLLIIPPSV